MIIMKAAIADIRLVSNASGDSALFFCKANRRLYHFDAADIQADNGTTILKPDNIVHPAPGRFLSVDGT